MTPRGSVGLGCLRRCALQRQTPIRALHSSPTAWSGHSKWSTIRHKKAALDQSRQAAWHKIASRITLAVKFGGNDPKTNSRLQQEILAAKAENMTKETINRAIARGGPRELGTEMSQLTYEVVLPGGIAFLIEVLTDKKARTASFLKGVISRFNGSFSSVRYNFVHKGVIVISSDQPNHTVLEQAISLGADDLEEIGDGIFKVFVEPHTLTSKVRALSDANYQIQSANTPWLPLPEAQRQLDSEESEKVSRFIGSLEANDDITAVYTNGIL